MCNPNSNGEKREPGGRNWMAGYHNANLVVGGCTKTSEHTCDICIIAKEIFLARFRAFETNDTSSQSDRSVVHIPPPATCAHVSKTIANQTYRRHGLRRPPRQLRGWHPTHQYRRRRIGRPLLLTALNSNMLMTSPPTVSVWWGEHEMCRLFVFMLAPVALRFDQARRGPVSGFSTFDAY